jgi:hypothetical protein
LAIKFEGCDCTVQVSSRIDDAALLSRVSREVRINSDHLYTGRVFNGLGSAHASQNGGTGLMFKNDAKRNEEIRNPRTKATLTSEQQTKPKIAKREGQPRAQCDWIAGLISRQDYERDEHKFWHQVDQEKMIHVVTDGRANPNPADTSRCCGNTLIMRRTARWNSERRRRR